MSDASHDSTPNERHLRLIRAAAERVAREHDGGHARDEGEILLARIQPYLSDYSLIRWICRGGQGHVFQAQQRSTQRLAAIKVLDGGGAATREKRERFDRELLLTSRLEHPGIVSILGGGPAGDYLYIAMQFVSGLPVDDYVLARQPTPRRIATIFERIARAVSSAHQQGVIHRDLKPANVLVDDEEAPHILDFGLARALDDLNEQRRISMPGQVLGTLEYLSPEQAAGQAHAADTRADVYALGVMLYESLARRRAYPAGLSIPELRACILSTPLPRLPRPLPSAASHDSVSTDDLDAIIARATAKEPAERYQSADALAEDLRRVLAGEAVAARADQAWYVAKKALRRYRRPLIAAACIFLLVTGLGIFSTVQWIEASRQRRRAADAAHLAQATLGTIVHEINTTVESLAGGSEARRKLHAVVRDDLLRLGDLAGSNAELADIKMQLHQNLGDIARTEGDDPLAVRHYLTSLEQLRRTPAFASGVPSARLREVELEVALASVAPDAGEYHRSALEHAAALTVVTQDDRAMDAHREALTEYLRFLSHRGRLRDAERALARHADCEPGADHLLTDPQSLSLAADYLECRGDVLIRVGRGSEGATALRRALVLREKLVQSQPANAVAIHKQVVAACRLSAFLRRDGDSDGALQLLKDAVADGRHLAAADSSSAPWTRDLVNALNRLSRLERRFQNYEAAFELADEAVRRMYAFVAPAKDTREWIRLLADSLETRGMAYSECTQLYESLADLTASNELLTALFARYGDQALLSDLCDNYARLGQTYARLGEFDEALRCHHFALSKRMEMHDRRPDSLAHGNKVVLSYLNLAVLHLEEDTLDDYATCRARLADAQELIWQLEASHDLTGFHQSFDRNRQVIHKDLRILEVREGECRRLVGETPHADATARALAAGSDRESP